VGANPDAGSGLLSTSQKQGVCNLDSNLGLCKIERSIADATDNCPSGSVAADPYVGRDAIGEPAERNYHGW